MVIRYVRDGLKIVRVEVERPPVERPPALPLLPAETRELGYRLRLFNAAILADAARAGQTLRQPAHQKSRRSPEAPSGVTAEELRLARTLAGRTQRQLAAELGFGRGLVADAELGRRSVPRSVGQWVRSVLEGQEGKP